MAGGKNRKVVFARVNRRQGNEPLQLRPFSRDMAYLAHSHYMTHLQKAAPTRPQRRWFAADMQIIPSGDFMTGTLGYAEKQQHVEFDQDAWSWIKGETRLADAGSEQTVVPFALDLRDKQRWVAFAPTARMRTLQFARGFQSVLNQAVLDAKLVPVEWEVDLVTSEGRVEAWIDQNPRVFFMQRTIKFSNPGRDLDHDRVEMQQLAANRKTEEFHAPRGRTMRSDTEEFRNKLAGTETGDLEIILRARGIHGERELVFNTRKNADESLVDDFGADLERGMDVMLRALREYVASKEGPEPTLDVGHGSD